MFFCRRIQGCSLRRLNWLSKALGLMSNMLGWAGSGWDPCCIVEPSRRWMTCSLLGLSTSHHQLLKKIFLRSAAWIGGFHYLVNLFNNDSLADTVGNGSNWLADAIRSRLVLDMRIDDFLVSHLHRRMTRTHAFFAFFYSRSYFSWMTSEVSKLAYHLMIRIYCGTLFLLLLLFLFLRRCQRLLIWWRSHRMIGGVVAQ